MPKTVDDLRRTCEELVERRRREAYALAGPEDQSGMARLVQLHLAIMALEAVIAEGRDQWEDETPTYDPDI